MAQIQSGSSTAGVANVDANFNLKTNTPTVAAQPGFVAMSVIEDPGAVTGAVLARAVRATTNLRQEVSLACPLFEDSFGYAAQDSGRWNVALTTFAVTYGVGGILINSGAVVTANAVALLKTYQQFSLPMHGALVFRGFIDLPIAPQPHNVIEFGFAYSATTAAPTDGAFFRYDATGTLKGVINNNGTEITSSSLTVPATGTGHKYEVVLDEIHAEFWIDGVLYAQVFGTGGVVTANCSGCGSAYVSALHRCNRRRHRQYSQNCH